MGVRELGTAEKLILAAVVIVVGLTSYGGYFEEAQGSPCKEGAQG